MFKKLYIKVRDTFLKIFGDLWISKFPCFLLYSPQGYRVTGEQTRDIIDIVQPGDILIRSYSNFLDNFFIPLGVSQCSHSGVFFSGNVYHSIAEGVVCSDIIEFVRCDRLVILRPKVTKRTIDKAYKIAKSLIGKPYDFAFDDLDIINDSNKQSDKQIVKHNVKQTVKHYENHAAYYCHEFSRHCYPSLNIKKLRVRNKLGMLGPEIYVADSFYTNKKFTIVKEF